MDRITCPSCGLEVAAGTPACPVDQTPLEQQAELLTGAQIGEYTVKGVVGSGGMGVVYEGVQPVIGKRVAIKVLRRKGQSVPEEAARLLSEARLVNAIRHRGIIDIFSFGQLPDGRQYFVMEFLDGIPLAEHVRTSAPLEVVPALQILDEILAALTAAHGAGVIHRDLKPSNVFLVDQPGGARYVKLLDFGIAKQAALRHGVAPQTHVSRIVGTPEFMAPEQARGEAVGPATDLYAMGCIAFELLTRRGPFEGSTGWEAVNHHLNTPPPPPSKFAEGIPEEVDALVLSLLEKAPGDRPESAEAVRQEIKSIRRLLQSSNTRLALPPTPSKRTDTEPSVVAFKPTVPIRGLMKAPVDPAAEQTNVSAPTLETVLPMNTLVSTLDSTDEVVSSFSRPKWIGAVLLAVGGAMFGVTLALVWPAPAPAVVLPEVSTHREERRSALLARIEALEKTPGAQGFIGELKAQAIAAKTGKELRQAEKSVAELERKFSPPGSARP